MMKRIGVLLAALFAAAACTTATTHAPSHTESGNREAVSPAPASSPHCGIERWAVKTGTDPAAGQVNLGDVHDTDIATLIKLAVPSGFNQDAQRLPGAEFTVYRIHATLVQYKMEADSDYHLVLHDSSGNSMIAEIPSPACVHGASPFLSGITHARKQFDAVYSPGNFWQPANVPVVVTGVGFFDTPHGQTGVAPNAFELHPVLDIQLGAAPTPSASPSASASTTAFLLRRCDERFDYRIWTDGGGAIGAETLWTNNTCIKQQRVHIECLDANLRTWKENGGWVVNVGTIWSSKICSDGHPPYTLVWADFEDRNGNGAPVTITRFYPNSAPINGGGVKPKPLAAYTVAYSRTACTPESPAYGYNRNSAGQDPPPWAFTVWPQGQTCGDWTNIKVKFCVTGHSSPCTGYEYGTHRTSIGTDSRVNGPLADSLSRAYMQIGGGNLGGTCHRRIFPSVARSWTC